MPVQRDIWISIMPHWLASSTQQHTGSLTPIQVWLKAEKEKKNTERWLTTHKVDRRRWQDHYSATSAGNFPSKVYDWSAPGFLWTLVQIQFNEDMMDPPASRMSQISFTVSFVWPQVSAGRQVWSMSHHNKRPDVSQVFLLVKMRSLHVHWFKSESQWNIPVLYLFTAVLLRSSPANTLWKHPRSVFMFYFLFMWV